MREPLQPPKGLAESLMPPVFSAAHFGWQWQPTPRVTEVVILLNERGIKTKLTETAQFEAIGWLQGISAQNLIIPNTLRGEELFYQIGLIQVLLISDGLPTIGELRAARDALLDAQKVHANAIFETKAVPPSVRRFGYGEGLETPLAVAQSAIENRLAMVEGELEAAEAAIVQIEKKVSESGQPPKWWRHWMLRHAADTFLNITGYKPARNLPVRSFEGFLTRFCADVPDMAGINYRRLADLATEPGGYKGRFIPFQSETEKQLWLSTGKRGTEYLQSG